MANTLYGRPYRNFDVIHVDDPQADSHLRSLILADEHNSPSPAGYALLDMIKSGRCKTVVVEKSYFDRDHLRAYQRFYARSFSDYGRYSTRLHFFSEKVTLAHLSDLERPRFAKSYLGFCVLRPLRVRKVGRTVLNPFTCDPDGDYPLGLATYDANVAGSRLFVRGAPFLEQDVNVGACATAAIWSSTAVAGRLLEVQPWTTAEITERAFDFPLGDQVLAARGLAVPQMENALRRMGYKPLTMGIKDEAAALEVIHPYLEGGIPPILLLRMGDDAHAVVAVGHGYDPSMTPIKQPQVNWEGQPIRYWRSSQWINYFLIHDDQRGPYRKMRLRGESDVNAWIAANPTGKPFCQAIIDTSYPSDGYYPTETIVQVFGAIIPIPLGVTLTGVEAEEKAARLMHMFFSGSTPTPTHLVLRTYLVRSNDYKRLTASRGLEKKVRDLIRGKALPRWLWVTEICQPSELSAPHGQRKILGEVVLDGNASPFTPDFLAFHIVGNDLGYLALMEPTDVSAADALSQGITYQHGEPYLAFSGPGAN